MRSIHHSIGFFAAFFLVSCQGHDDSPCQALRSLTSSTLKLHLHSDPKETDAMISRTLSELNGKSEESDLCVSLEEYALQNQSDDPKEPYRRVFQRLVKNLDPHSNYWTPQDYAHVRSVLKGEALGFGVVFRSNLTHAFRPLDKDEGLEVEEVVPGTPADGKLKIGDRILEINHQTLSGQRRDSILSMIRSAKDQTLTLTYQRGDEVLQTEVLVTSFQVKPVFWRKLSFEGRTFGMIKIRTFMDKGKGGEDTADLVDKAIVQLSKNGRIDGWMIDVRDNPGGFRVEETLDHFVSKGTVMVMRGKKVIRRNAKNSSSIQGLPMVVLMNHETASAGEILAGVLGHERAILVGTETFGKGTSQAYLDLTEKHPFGGLLFITTAYFYLPGGSTPQLHGVQPHILVREPSMVALFGNQVPLELSEKKYGSKALPNLGTQLAGTPSADWAPTVSQIQDLFERNASSSKCDSDSDCALEIGLTVLSYFQTPTPQTISRNHHLSKENGMRYEPTHLPDESSD